MPRNTSATLNTLLDGVVTAVGYLVRMETNSVIKQGRAPAVVQVCDIGSYQSDTLGSFQQLDFSLNGIGEGRVTLEAQNVDGAMGSFILNANPLAQVRVSIWQFEARAPNDAVALGVFLPIRSNVGLDKASIDLGAVNMKYRYAPNKIISRRNGFNYALRPGEVLLWGGTRVLIKDSR